MASEAFSYTSIIVSSGLVPMVARKLFSVCAQARSFARRPAISYANTSFMKPFMRSQAASAESW